MKLRTRLQALLGRKRLDAEMSEEIRLHLELQTEQNIAAGIEPDEARYAALRQFGGVEQVKERCRDQRSWVWLELAIKEIGFAVRSLRRAPGFSLAVLTTLALCLGPNTAILSALYTFVYKPLPFHEPSRLVAISNVAERQGGAKRQSSIAQYLDFKAHADRFEGFTCFNSKNIVIGDQENPAHRPGLETSADFFSVLGVQPLLGRYFSADETTPGKSRVVVLSRLAWSERYGGDPNVIGREIRMDDEPFTVIGVAPGNFEELFNDVEFFRPYPIEPSALDPQTRYANSVRLIGRLKPRVTPAAGRAQLAVLEKTFDEDVAAPGVRSFLNAGGYQIAINDARQEFAEPVKTPLLLLQGGAALVLLIGCVNVASLLLARATTKRPELAVRHALGAGRASLLRQMLAESALLVGMAGAIGVGLAVAMLRVMNHYLPTVMRHVPPVELDLQVVGVVLGVLTLIVAAMGTVPFGSLWRSGLRIGEAAQSSGSRGARRAVSALVIGQIAFALVLLIGAGVLIHSFARVMAVEPGFDAERVVEGRINLPKARYRKPAARVAMQQRVLAAMKEIQGVEAASLTSEFAVADRFRALPFVVRSGPVKTEGDRQVLVYLNAVSPGYFATMGISLHGGRDFRDDDDFQKNPVAIVDQTFAERYFPGRDVVGQEIAFGATPPAAGQPWIRIVGVVSRATLAGLEKRDGWSFVYLPFNQVPSLSFSILVRSPRLGSDIVSEMRTRAQAIDPTLPLHVRGSLQSGLDAMLGNRRALVTLLGLFAALALGLAAVGLYGVLNYDVTQRTREIGIRAALGATRTQLLAMVLRQGLGKAGLGLAAGLAGAFFLARLLRGMLFDVSATDPVAYGAVAVLLLAVALGASWLPARRAAKVDPMVALRCE